MRRESQWRHEMLVSEMGVSRRILPPAREPSVIMAASTYGRLLATADLAPLYALQIPQIYLQRAATMGYTHIGHVRLIPPAKLAQDLGEDATEAILGTLAAYGLAELLVEQPT